jgi:NADPH-dependent 2,4-dienoyl-CoA reductase/sulfur reductase-like enzyme
MNAADEIIKTFHVKVPSGNALQGEHFPDELYFLMQPKVPVAFYTQQCRALNLIWALAHDSAETRRIGGKRVVIVGAGAAGLTAAVGAVLAGAKKVTVLEKANTPMSLQLGCEHRFLHPHFHTWPKESSHSAAAALPFLSWHVGTAGEVAERLRAEFDRWVREVSRNKLDLICSVSNIEFKSRTDPRAVASTTSSASKSWIPTVIS